MFTVRHSGVRDLFFMSVVVNNQFAVQSVCQFCKAEQKDSQNSELVSKVCHYVVYY